MNPVEIEEAVSNLALEPFDRAEFPFQFLPAFGNKDTALARLRAGNTNQSDVPGAVLQRGNIHIAACAPGAVDATLSALRESPKTASQKAKFILATDGEVFQAEDLSGTDTVACTYAAFPDHVGFCLPLAGITTVAQIRESSFDIRATARLNKLYIELLKDNPDWASADRRHDMNHFMARLAVCRSMARPAISSNGSTLCGWIGCARRKTAALCWHRSTSTACSIASMRSLQRQLNEDDAGRRITEPSAGPLFADKADDGEAETCTIYVLRSKSDHPVVAEHREVMHKIGVTSGAVETRISGAEKSSTYLLAGVEVVATYKVYGMNCQKLENLIHKVFSEAQINLSIPDRFGHMVKSREWFLVPLSVINEAVERIRDRSILSHRYDLAQGSLVRISPWNHKEPCRADVQSQQSLYFGCMLLT